MSETKCRRNSFFIEIAREGEESPDVQERAEVFRKEEEEKAAQKEKDNRLIHEKNVRLFEEALQIAKEADEVIFVGGLNHDFDRNSGKGFARFHSGIITPQNRFRLVSPRHFHRGTANQRNDRVFPYIQKFLNKHVLFIRKLHIASVKPFAVKVMIQAADKNNLEIRKWSMRRDIMCRKNRRLSAITGRKRVWMN